MMSGEERRKQFKRFLVSCILGVIASNVLAQSGERYILPVAVRDPVPGAFGSLFKTEFWILNTGTAAVTILVDCNILCDPIRLQPNEAGLNVGYIHSLGSSLYGFGQAESGPANDLKFSLRIQDVSRQALTWGTEVPVVRERDMKGTVHLIDVPTDSRFRQALRLYSFTPGQVRLRIHELRADRTGPALLVDEILTLASMRPAAGEPFSFQILNLVAAFPQIASSPRTRIELIGLGDAKLWAFVSITNNETQHITLITPQE